MTVSSSALRGGLRAIAALAPRERPILFSGPMVRAILEGRKTQTRRVVGATGVQSFELGMETPEFRASMPSRCRYGSVGDRLWVRETWALVNDGGYAVDPSTLCYRADGATRLVQPRELLSHKPLQTPRPGWRPSIHIRRWASRIMLEITEVRVERLLEISQADAMREGAQGKHSFVALWDGLNAKRGYGAAANPWVWVIGFTHIQRAAAA